MPISRWRPGTPDDILGNKTMPPHRDSAGGGRQGRINQMLKSLYLASSSAAAFAVVALTAGAAGAQTAAATPSTVEEVVVTGSFIAGTPKDTAIPVAVIRQA